eukprot:gene10068-11143_t
MSGKERLKETNEFSQSFKDKIRDRALKIYKNELNRPTSIDLGLHGVSRAALRTLCRDAVLQASQTMRRRYSHSALSSSIQTITENNNAISALRLLQKERLIVSRLGFPDRAMEIDKEIEVMREKAKKARGEEENRILFQRMKTLGISQSRKQQRLEYILGEETRQMKERFRHEEEKMLRRQEVEFLRVLENASRRAIGRVKKCNCIAPYMCRHNKTASYNTRRPTHTVVIYRRNAKRLRAAGRPEEAQTWDEKAKELDEAEQERWRTRVARSIVSSPWGANEAAVDQITESHKRELAVLRKTHDVKRDMHEKKQAMRRKNFMNTMLAEQRKVRMQCRKQALLRIRRDYNKEKLEEDRQRQLVGHSDGLSNISKNLLGMQFDEDEKKQVDWVAPTTFGLDNSVRLIDAVKEIDRNAVATIESDVIGGRILTTKKDIRNLTTDQLRDKIHANLKADNSDEDSDSDEDGGGQDNEDEEEVVYKLGVTSGSKLVDKMRIIAKEKKVDMPSSSSTAPTLNTWQGVGSSTNNPFPAPAFGGGSPLPATSPFASSATYSAPWMTTTMGNNNSPLSSSTMGGTMGLGGNNTQPFNAASLPWASSLNNNNNNSNMSSMGNNNFLSFSFPGANTMNQNTSGIPSGTSSTGLAPAAPSLPAPTTPSYRAGSHLSATTSPAAAVAGGLSTPPPLQSSQPTNPFAFPLNMSEKDRTNPVKSTQGSVLGGSDQTPTKPMSSSITKTSPPPPRLPKKIERPPPYIYDPIADEQPIAFKAGSVKDIDWTEHDTQMNKTNGKENSYGIPIVEDDDPSKQLDPHLEKEIEENLDKGALIGFGGSPQKAAATASSFDHKLAVFGPGHAPPSPYSADSLPGKSVLTPHSHYGKKGIRLAQHSHGALKKVQFGQIETQVFEPYEENEQEIEEVQQNGSSLSNAHSPVVDDMDEPVPVTSLLSVVALKKLDLMDEKLHYKQHKSAKLASNNSNTVDGSDGMENYGGESEGVPSTAPSVSYVASVDEQSDVVNSEQVSISAPTSAMITPSVSSTGVMSSTMNQLSSNTTTFLAASTMPLGMATTVNTSFSTPMKESNNGFSNAPSFPSSMSNTTPSFGFPNYSMGFNNMVDANNNLSMTSPAPIINNNSLNNLPQTNVINRSDNMSQNSGNSRNSQQGVIWQQALQQQLPSQSFPQQTQNLSVPSTTGMVGTPPPWQSMPSTSSSLLMNGNNPVTFSLSTVQPVGHDNGSQRSSQPSQSSGQQQPVPSANYLNQSFNANVSPSPFINSVPSYDNDFDQTEKVSEQGSHQSKQSNGSHPSRRSSGSQRSRHSQQLSNEEMMKVPHLPSSSRPGGMSRPAPAYLASDTTKIEQQSWSWYS